MRNARGSVSTLAVAVTYFGQKGERPNEESHFGCRDGGNADGTQYSTIIGRLLLPLASLLSATTSAPVHLLLQWHRLPGRHQTRQLVRHIRRRLGDCAFALPTKLARQKKTGAPIRFLLASAVLPRRFYSICRRAAVASIGSSGAGNTKTRFL
jgi:hypothetical protein